MDSLVGRAVELTLDGDVEEVAGGVALSVLAPAGVRTLVFFLNALCNKHSLHLCNSRIV